VACVRDIFVYVSKLLHVARMSETELKHHTNVLLQNNIQWKSDSGELMLSEGYSWDWDPKIFALAHDSQADAVMSNHAVSHRYGPTYAVERKFLDTEFAYWQGHRLNNTNNGKPHYKFHQGAKDVHGKKDKFDLWGPENFRSLDTMLKKHFATEGFMYVDEWLITAGRIDGYATRGDGWHFFGSMRLMEAEIIFNMLCNDWLRNLSSIL
jgi:hypothetical protein